MTPFIRCKGHRCSSAHTQKGGPARLLPRQPAFRENSPPNRQRKRALFGPVNTICTTEMFRIANPASQYDR